MKKTLCIFIFFSIFLTLIACKNNGLEKRNLTITKSDGTTITISAEIAKTNEDRARGYMGRKKIPEGTGMLFVFERDQVLSFWMKNTPTPLSIAYIDSKGKIRDIFHMEPYCLDSIISTVSVRYALEVPQGWFEKNGIKKGDYLNLPSHF